MLNGIPSFSIISTSIQISITQTLLVLYSVPAFLVTSICYLIILTSISQLISILIMVVNLNTSVLMVVFPFSATTVTFSHSIISRNTASCSSSRDADWVASGWICFSELRVVILLSLHLTVVILSSWALFFLYSLRVLFLLHSVRDFGLVTNVILIMNLNWEFFRTWMCLRKILVTILSSVWNIVTLKRYFLSFKSWLIILLIYPIFLNV